MKINSTAFDSIRFMTFLMVLGFSAVAAQAAEIDCPDLDGAYHQAEMRDDILVKSQDQGKFKSFAIDLGGSFTINVITDGKTRIIIPVAGLKGSAICQGGKLIISRTEDNKKEIDSFSRSENGKLHILQQKIITDEAEFSRKAE